MRRSAIALLASAAAIAAAALGAPTASAHVGQITITCTKVHFAYTSFTNGAAVNESVTIDNQPFASKQFTFSGTSGSDNIVTNLSPGTHTVSAHADWTADGGGSVDKTQTISCHPPCPSGTDVHFRWHYSANGTSGSWSATKGVTCPGSISIGPQSMEGDLKVSPGDTLKAGYSFTIPGNNSSLFVTVNHPKVVFTVRCVSGAAPSQSTFTVSMPTHTYAVTNSQWIPSGDQHSPLVYQGSVSVPNLCGGGKLRLDKGGTFSASIS